MWSWYIPPRQDWQNLLTMPLIWIQPEQLMGLWYKEKKVTIKWRPQNILSGIISRKINISYPLIRICKCAYQGVGNVSFSKNVAYVLNDPSLLNQDSVTIYNRRNDFHLKVFNLKQSDFSVFLLYYMLFKVNLHFALAWMSRNSLLKKGAISEIYVAAAGLEPTTTHLVNEHSQM